jgi:hypothetical protein
MGVTGAGSNLGDGYFISLMFENMALQGDLYFYNRNDPSVATRHVDVDKNDVIMGVLFSTGRDYPETYEVFVDYSIWGDAYKGMRQVKHVYAHDATDFAGKGTRVDIPSVTNMNGYPSSFFSMISTLHVLMSGNGSGGSPDIYKVTEWFVDAKNGDPVYDEYGFDRRVVFVNMSTGGYDGSPKTIAGYEYMGYKWDNRPYDGSVDGTGNPTLASMTENREVYFVYTTGYTVIEKFVDLYGNDIGESDTFTHIPVGSTYSKNLTPVNDCTYKGYRWDDPPSVGNSYNYTPGNPDSLTVTRDRTIYFVCARIYTITEKYADIFGADISVSDTSTQVEQGNTYSKILPAVSDYNGKGYRWDDPPSDSNSYNYLPGDPTSLAISGNRTMYLVYVRVYTITEKYVDFDGAGIGVDDTSTTVEQGNDYSFTIPPVSGYVDLGYKLHDKPTDVSDYTAGNPADIEVLADADIYLVYAALTTVTVSKQVSGSFADMTAGFTFTVTFTDVEGNPLSNGTTFSYDGGALPGMGANGPAQDGTLNLTGGKDTYRLKHGQTITIKDVPANYLIKFEETPVKSYAATYRENPGGDYSTANSTPYATSLANMDSTLVGNEGKTFDIMNTINISPPTGINGGNQIPAILALIAILFGLPAFAAIGIIRKRMTRFGDR